jgi:hypothetical protein
MNNAQSILIARLFLLIFVFWMIIHSAIAQRWGIMVAGALSVYHLAPWQFWEWLTEQNYRATDNKRFLMGISVFLIAFALYYRHFLS